MQFRNDPFVVINTGCFCPFFPVFLKHLLVILLLEFFECHSFGNTVGHFPDLIDPHILVCHRVILYRCLDVRGIFKVQII